MRRQATTVPQAARGSSVSDTHRVEAGANRLEDLLNILGTDHAPHGLTHLLHDGALRFLKLALGDVTGDAVSADERIPAVQAVGGDREVPHVHLDVAGDAATGEQPHFPTARRSPVRRS